MFLGKLCNLSPDLRVKKVSVYRLIQDINNPISVTGFFPDIYGSLGKYGLECYMYIFIKFPLETVL